MASEKAKSAHRRTITAQESLKLSKAFQAIIIVVGLVLIIDNIILIVVASAIGYFLFTCSLSLSSPSSRTPTVAKSRTRDGAELT